MRSGTLAQFQANDFQAVVPRVNDSLHADAHIDVFYGTAANHRSHNRFLPDEASQSLAHLPRELSRGGVFDNRREGAAEVGEERHAPGCVSTLIHFR